MAIRPGARELGLDIQWRYHFMGPGSVVEPMRDAVFLDVGNKLMPGIIDQHHDGSLGASTSALILRYPELAYRHLMDGWLERRDNGQDLRGRAFQPLLVTHVNPDFDAMVSCWLVQRLIEDGEVPATAGPLTEYESEVDQGRYKVRLDAPWTATHALHMGYLGLQCLQREVTPSSTSPHLWCLEEGFALLAVVLAAIPRLARGTQFVPLQSWADDEAHSPAVWRTLPRFERARELVDSDLALYAADEKDAKCNLVLLPAADGLGTLKVPTLVLRRSPRSKLNKYWVRASGYPYFVCPYCAEEDPESQNDTGREHYDRVILSLDPMWRAPDGRRPSLTGLGRALEQAEVTYRESHGGDNRLSVPRYSDDFCTNDDPWYDGRGHDFTIVDSPREGTLQPYARITAMAVGESFWHSPLTGARVRCITFGKLPPIPAGSLHSGPARPEQLRATLNEWFDHCQAMTLDGSQWRALPNCGDAHANEWGARIRDVTEASQCQSVEHLMGVMENELAAGREGGVLIADIVLKRQFSDGELLALTRQVVGDATIVSLGQGQRLLVSTRAIVRVIQNGCTDQTQMWEPGGAGFELVFYLTSLANFLVRFSAQVSLVIRGHGAHHGLREDRAIALDREFLVLQARYWQVECTDDPALRRVRQELSKSHELEAHYQEVQDEVTRLSSLAAKHANDRLTEVMLGVAFLGIAQTALAAFSFEQKSEGLFIAGIVTLVCVLAYFATSWLLRRGTRAEDDRG